MFKMATKEAESDKKPPVLVPPGLQSIIEQCQEIYPDQPNPLQVTTVVKYWLGGHDPLDYISMYYNKGDVDRDIPPHWHYISFGLSDLHGDGRVHVNESPETENAKSGMGFELTFRLLKTECENGTVRPPTWPANLLQALARYCFQTGNSLCAGDNVPWRKSLDGSESKIMNMLIAEDPQLARIETPFGYVEFCQIVGVTNEEIEQASRWNGKGILNLLKCESVTGGEWLITDMERAKSVFELFPETLCQLEDDLEKEGSDLAGINADFTFKEIHQVQRKAEMDSKTLNNQRISDEKPDVSKDTNSNDSNEDSRFLESMSVNNSLQTSCPINYQPPSVNVIPMDGIEVNFAPSAAKFLKLAVKDRIRHGRHFTFKAQHLALTFVAESVTGSVVSKDSPYGVFGYWIQVLIPEELIPRMMEDFKNMPDEEENFTNDIFFEYPDRNLRIIVRKPSRKCP